MSAESKSLDDSLESIIEATWSREHHCAAYGAVIALRYSYAVDWLSPFTVRCSSLKIH